MSFKRIRRFNPRFALGCILWVTSLSAVTAQELSPSLLSQWPEGRSPQEIGLHVAEHFVTSPHMDMKPIIYPEFCAWYGALQYASATRNQRLADELIARYQPLLSEKNASLVPHDQRHVDYEIYGILPLQIYRMTGERKYLDIGIAYADRQWDKPTPEGLSSETRFWIDDMYMMTILQVQAYRATKDPKYIDRMAQEVAAYLDRLQQPTGLFYHALDVPLYWSRGNGWVAAGITELLLSLPENHPQRARILSGYRTMMKALIRYQGKDGMWRELVDDDSAWPESSGSAMFTFALIEGVRHGWLNAATYAPHARNGWIALSGYVDQNWDLTNVCEGTNKLNDRKYYLLRRRKTGDFHGQAPLLWAATALVEPEPR
jgi:unsaturated rhamnogalacturonyl hydrolase